MEALAIGLAVYGVGMTLVSIHWRRVAEGWRNAALGQMRSNAFNAGQVAKMDHDGDGKIGGSKPRGKG
jgi:hypothetical protein